MEDSATTRIEFRNVDVSRDGWIRCEVVREAAEDLWIQLPYSFMPKYDLVAAAFVSFCGRRFDEIYLDLPLDPLLKERLEACAEAKIDAADGLEVRRRRGVGMALNFSGGFDSLAARMMSPGADLVSLDFGGRFSREREFFQRFNPLTFATNLVDMGLNRYSWEFMGLGSVLLTDELNIGTYSFGSILAGSMPRVLDRPLHQDTVGVGAARELGLVCRNPIVGASEIATLAMALSRDPTLMTDVLRSVALPGEDKFIRKSQMLRAVCAATGNPVAVPEPDSVKPKRSWGSSFATDLSSLYVMQVLGVDEVVESYIDGVPPRVLDAVPALNLDFMWRVNPHPYAGVEHRQMADWLGVLVRCGILPYAKDDWVHARTAVDLLQSTVPKSSE